MVNAIRIVFVVLTIAYLSVLLRDFKRAKDTGLLEKEEEGFGKAGVIGFIANFADTLGIGAFAPIVAMSKFTKMKIHNKEIPAMLNIGCCASVMTEAFIFTTTIKVDPTTLIVMLAAAGLGSYIGAGIISKMDERKVQLVMGIALFITAILMFLGLPWIDLMPGGGNEIGLTGTKLIIGAVGNFILGALMTAGIGLYAPCMALVYFLGMSAKVAYPIMMGSCAVLMPVASIRFIKEGNYPRKATLGIVICGAIGVVLAATLVKNLPMDIMKAIVVVVILYTSYSMLAPLAKARKAKLAEGNVTGVVNE